MKYIHCILLFLCPIISGAQSNYHDPKVMREIYLSDDFSSNPNGWYEGSTNDIEKYIRNGQYHIKCKSNNGYWGNWIPDKTIIPDLNGDFELEMTLKIFNNNNSDGQYIFGFMFGFSPDQFSNSHHCFGVTNYGYALYYGSQNNTKTSNTDWLESSAVAKNDFNTITVRKVGSEYFFFVNQEFVQKVADLQLYGNHVAIRHPQNAEVLVDDYRISTIKYLTENTPPEIVLYSPSVENRGFKQTESLDLNISGNAKDSDGVFQVLINGSQASLDQYGNFQKSIQLSPGENFINIQATDKKLASSTLQFTAQSSGSTSATNNKGSSFSSQGNYYALIIGVNEYQDESIQDLDNPLKDAQALYDVLTTKYTFDPQRVTILKNPGRIDMTDALDELSNRINANDNLLIFYAGHGMWDDQKNVGYWLPSDAKKDRTGYYIRNSTINEFVSTINSKHTLLITDACFGGSIFKTRSAFDNADFAINKLYELKSRKAMTSGTLKEVPDESVFLKYLVRRLSENTNAFLSAGDLFSQIRIPVMNNSPNVPQFGTLQNTNDEGGDFVFIKR